MKRIVAAVVILGLILSFAVGCSNNNNNPQTTTSDNSTSSEDYSSNDISESSGLSSGDQSDSSSSAVVSNGSTSTSTDNTKYYSGNQSEFILGSPFQGQYLHNQKPTFIWSSYDKAKYFNLYIEEYKNGKFVEAYKKTNIIADSYKLPVALKQDTTYRWRVEAMGYDNKIYKPSANPDGNTFIAYINPKEHPANSGLDFSFKDTISEKVLKNYLGRSVVFSFLRGDKASRNELDDDRFIINTGAKFIARSHCAWIPSTSEESLYPEVKKRIERLHAIDPDIIFEACIFEFVDDNVNGIEIPDWVFKAFNLPVENRNFRKKDMVFSENLGGLGKNTVPDMTKLETQMWFYYRGKQFIDLGFEALHMGQVHLIGSTDKRFENWFKVCNMIREYAKKHARRGMVLLNAHTLGITNPNGNLLFDFHSHPLFPYVDPNQPQRLPTEDNPLRITYDRYKPSFSIYTRSKGGIAPSGWKVSSLPYFVELDNGGGVLDGDPKNMGNPKVDYAPWGFDVISWFVNQPQWYRHEVMDYTYKWIKETDPQGAFEFAGSRSYGRITSYDIKNPAYKMDWYQANSKLFNEDGYGDEEQIRAVWIKYKHFLNK